MQSIIARSSYDPSLDLRSNGAIVREAIDRALASGSAAEVSFEGVSPSASYMDEIFGEYDASALLRIQVTGLAFVGKELFTRTTEKALQAAK